MSEARRTITNEANCSIIDGKRVLLYLRLRMIITMRSIIRRAENCLLRPYGWGKSQVQRLQKPRPVNFPIDFVITWVDGSDPEWRKSRALYMQKDVDYEGNPESRYRDWGWLKYWFRAVEQYAPWVNKVYFVTCGQKPDWLNLQHEKLVFVTHQDFIPAEYLPTFNSNTIELNLWRIPGLSEHFVYFNDDVFLNRPVMPEDFFHNGLPKLCSLAIPFRYMYYENGLDKWLRMALNDIAVINSSFDIREAIRKHPEKFFSYVFRRQAKINKMIFDYNGIAGMFHTHTVQIFQKEVFREIWNRWSAVLDRTCRFRFRNEEQVTPFLPALWQIFEGEYYPERIRYFGKYFPLASHTLQQVLEALRSGKHRFLCLNDAKETDRETDDAICTIQKTIKHAMEAKFPDSSRYEKIDLS